MLDAVSKDIPFSIKTLLILLISAFFVKNQHFFANIVPFHKAIVWDLCFRFSSSLFNFCKIKVYCWWKHKFYRLCVRNRASGLLQIGYKLKHNGFTVFWYEIIVKVFWHCFVSLVKFSYWSKFHIDIITGSWVMTFTFKSDWPEIRKLEIPLSEFCSISGDQVELRILNFTWTSPLKCH